MTTDLEPAFPGHDPRRAPMFTRGDYLRKALQVAGISNQEMADYLGVSRNTISNMINDRVKPKRQTLILWALRCGVSPAWLSSGTYSADPDDELMHQAYDLADEFRRRGALQDYDQECAARESNPQPAGSVFAVVRRHLVPVRAAA